MPASRATFFQAMLESVATIERDGWLRFEALGSTRPARQFATGGCAGNAAFQRIRERLLGRPSLAPLHRHMACGAAMLAAGAGGVRPAATVIR
jgi:D-ribulokinase